MALALSVVVGVAPAHATLEPPLAARGDALHGAPAAARPFFAVTPFGASIAEPPISWSLTAPTEPLVEGASGVVFSGGLLYITSYSATAGHSSLSVVNPTTHEIVGSVTNSDLDGATSLAVSGAYVYVTGVQNSNTLANANRLTIVDVSNPEKPTIVGTVQESVVLYGAYGVEVAGNLAYVAAQGCVPTLCASVNASDGNRLVIVDVSEKAHPRVIGSVTDPTATTDHLDAIAVAGNRVYGTAFNAKTLTVFDVTDPTQPAIIGSMSSPLLAGADDVVVRGRYAYVIDQSSSNARLVVVDVTNQEHPTIVGSVLDTTDLAEGYWLKLVGHDVFVAVGKSNALTVVDISNPAQPVVVASHSSSSQLGAADGIDVAGSTAYVAAFCTTPNSGCSNPTTGALTALDVSPYTALDLTAGPPADDTSTTTEIFFTSPEPGTTFTCSLDEAPAVPCSSPWVPSSSLAAGAHSLNVTASTDPTPANWSWTVLPAQSPPPESTPPSSSPPGTTGANPGSTSSSPSVSITANVRPDSIAITSSIAKDLYGTARITLTCAGLPASGCKGTLELQLRTIVQIGHGPHRQTRIRLVRIASVGYSIATGASAQLKIPLSTVARNALAHADGHRLQVQVTVTIAGGRTATRIIPLAPSPTHR